MTKELKIVDTLHLNLKKHKIIIVFLGIFAVIMTLLLMHAVAKPNTRINNMLSENQSTFELPNDLGWEMAGNVLISQTQEVAREGKGALKIEFSKIGRYQDKKDSSGRAQTLRAPDSIPVTAGQQYNGEMWIRNSESSNPETKARCEIRWYNKKKKIIGTNTDAKLTQISSEWSKIECQASAVSGAKSAALRVYITDNVKRGHIHYIDDVKFGILEVVETEYTNLLNDNQSYMETSSNLGWEEAGNLSMSHNVNMAHSGNGSIKLEISSEGAYQDNKDPSGRAQTLRSPNGIEVTPGHTYNGSLWITADQESTTSARCEVRWYNSSKKRIGTYSDAEMHPVSKSHWEQLNCEATAPEGAVQGALRVYIKEVVKDSDSFYVDDALFYDLNQDNPPTSDPALSPPDPDEFPDPEPEPDPTPEPQDPEPEPTPLPDDNPTGSPTQQWIIDNAGPSNPSILKPSGTVTVTTPGAVVKNLDISGSIIVKADNVTIRNVKMSGSTNTALIKIERDVKGTTVEHCKISVDSGGANGGVGYLGNNTTVRYCEIEGYADGIKAESGGLYEYNYIHMYKPTGSEKHLDGIQGSGDTNYTIRYNYIDAAKARGGNAAIFVQAFSGARCSHVYDVYVYGNYVLGGNYTVYMNGGKEAKASCDYDQNKWIHNYNLTDNVFYREDALFGYIRVHDCAETTVSGNVFTDGAKVPNSCG